MPAQPVDLGHVLPYETTYFDDRLTVDRNDLDISALLGVSGNVPDELLVALCGAPAGSDIQAYLDSADRLTFAVTHPTLIRSENRVSVLQTRTRPYSNWDPSILSITLSPDSVQRCYGESLERAIG